VISESILEGQKVRLRPVEERDLPFFVEWLADKDVTRWLAAVDEPPTLEDEHDWYESARADENGVLWSIETLDGDLVGSTDLRLAPHAERAELGIAIQDKTRWSEGLGTDAIRLVVEYAFDELGLHRVELQTDEANARAIRCYEKVGFVREGLLRDHRKIEGHFSNTIQMSVLAGEWQTDR
jgi:RimJ/RimL family protein N-acetyltransferase